MSSGRRIGIQRDQKNKTTGCVQEEQANLLKHYYSERVLRPRSLTSEHNLPTPNLSAFGHSEKKRTNLAVLFNNTPNTPMKRSPSDERQTQYERVQSLLCERYHTMQPIANTKTSIVYQAIEKQNNSWCAVKHLHDSFLKSSERQKSALLEFRNALLFKSHPNIVRYDDYLHCGVFVYFQMELCDEGSLENYLRINTLRDANHENDNFWMLALDILLGLSFIHKKGYAHLDIKPGNIFLVSKPNSPVPTAKIGDFGISRKIGSTHRSKYKKGDGRYLAPELLDKNLPITDRVDIFSLGVTFYEMAGLHMASSVLWEELQGYDGNIDVPLFSNSLNQILRRMLVRNPDLRSPAISLILFSEKLQQIANLVGVSIPAMQNIPIQIEEEEFSDMDFDIKIYEVDENKPCQIGGREEFCQQKKEEIVSFPNSKLRGGHRSPTVKKRLVF